MISGGQHNHTSHLHLFVVNRWSPHDLCEQVDSGGAMETA